MLALYPDNRFAPSDDVLVVEEQGTFYIIPPLSLPIRLNHTASDLWRMAASQATLSEVIRAYAALYACPEDQCADEVIHFMRTMIEPGYLRIITSA